MKIKIFKKRHYTLNFYSDLKNLLIQIYKVVISSNLCLFFVCPIITHEPFERLAVNVLSFL